MKLGIYKCIKCGDEIFSRARHDLKTCSCGALSVDGGFFNGSAWQCTRILGDIKCPRRIVSIDADGAALVDDWNSKKDKYGTFTKGPGIIPQIKVDENDLAEFINKKSNDIKATVKKDGSIKINSKKKNG